MMIATPHLLLFLTSRSYVLGRKANEKERQAALQVADGFISRMRYSPNTQVRTNPCPHLLLLVPSWGSLPQPEQNLDTSGIGSRLACLRPVRWKGLSVLQPFKETKQNPKHIFRENLGRWKGRAVTGAGSPQPVVFSLSPSTAATQVILIPPLSVRVTCRPGWPQTL